MRETKKRATDILGQNQFFGSRPDFVDGLLAIRPSRVSRIDEPNGFSNSTRLRYTQSMTGNRIDRPPDTGIFKNGNVHFIDFVDAIHKIRKRHFASSFDEKTKKSPTIIFSYVGTIVTYPVHKPS